MKSSTYCKKIVTLTDPQFGKTDVTNQRQKASDIGIAEEENVNAALSTLKKVVQNFNNERDLVVASCLAFMVWLRGIRKMYRCTLFYLCQVSATQLVEHTC